MDRGDIEDADFEKSLIIHGQVKQSEIDLLSSTKVQCHYLKEGLAPLYQPEAGYPIVRDSTPLPTFIVLDCKTGALFAKNIPDYELDDCEARSLGEVKKVGELLFDVDPRLSLGAFNKLIAEIKPMVKQVGATVVGMRF